VSPKTWDFNCFVSTEPMTRLVLQENSLLPNSELRIQALICEMTHSELFGALNSELRIRIKRICNDSFGAPNSSSKFAVGLEKNSNDLFGAPNSSSMTHSELRFRAQ